MSSILIFKRPFIFFSSAGHTKSTVFLLTVLKLIYHYDNIAIMESSCSSGTPKSTRQLYVFSLKVLPSAE